MATQQSSVQGSSISFTKVEHWFDSTKAGEPRMRVLHPIDIDIRPGEFVSIVGPSGCGKTTLLNMVSGLVSPGTGQVRVGGRTPEIGALNVGYLFARDSLVPWRTAAGNVSLALEFRKVPAKLRPAIMAESLAAVGLADFADAYPSQLSHGMRQRVAIARTLAPAPDTLLMDEPFSALDAQTRLVLQEQFAQVWQHRGSTVILVTHDLAEAILLSDRVVILSRRPGRVKAEFTTNLPRPRKVAELQGSKEFHDLYQEIWRVFREEVMTGEENFVAA
ncbi:MAG: ABC transporter ATP-binding protein [Ramlibacter sp.]